MVVECRLPGRQDPGVRYFSNGFCWRERWRRPAWKSGFAMRQSYSSPYPNEIVHPTCARCGAPMWLIRIEPDEPGKALQTFECQACGNSTDEVVKFNSVAPASEAKP
jgi:hypothetical protein